MVTKREDRLYQVCHSSKDVEDEQHFLCGCPACSDVGQKHASLFQQAFSVSDIFINSEPNACGIHICDATIAFHHMHAARVLLLRFS